MIKSRFTKIFIVGAVVAITAHNSFASNAEFLSSEKLKRLKYLVPHFFAEDVNTIPQYYFSVADIDNDEQVVKFLKSFLSDVTALKRASVLRVQLSEDDYADYLMTGYDYEVLKRNSIIVFRKKDLNSVSKVQFEKVKKTFLSLEQNLLWVE